MAQNGSRYPSTKAVEADGNAYTIYRGLHMNHIQNKANVMNNEPELKYQDGTSAYGHDTDDRQIVFPETIFTLYSRIPSLVANFSICGRSASVSDSWSYRTERSAKSISG